MTCSPRVQALDCTSHPPGLIAREHWLSPVSAPSALLSYLVNSFTSNICSSVTSVALPGRCCVVLQSYLHAQLAHSLLPRGGSFQLAGCSVLLLLLACAPCWNVSAVSHGSLFRLLSDISPSARRTKTHVKWINVLFELCVFISQNYPYVNNNNKGKFNLMKRCQIRGRRVCAV